MTARKPCGAWVVDDDRSAEMDVGPLLLSAWPDGHGSCGWDVTEAGDESAAQGRAPTVESAQLAAEDAARDLLLGGLAVLGAGMPEGWRIERFKSSIVLRDPEDVGVFVGSEAKADALALGMLAAVRK